MTGKQVLKRRGNPYVILSDRKCLPVYGVGIACKNCWRNECYEKHQRSS